jgi:tight adherence protein B
VGIVLLITGSPIYVAGAAGLIAMLGVPRFLLSYLTKRRQKKFLAEFANAIDIIVRGVKSGLPLNDCLQIIAAESPEPVKTEFVELMEQQRVGVTLAQGLERMLSRMPLAEVSFFMIVISIQQQAGGNLAEALGNLANVLRDRKRLKSKVDAFSSEAKSSAAIIGALPLAVMGLVYVSTPAYISLLWTEKLGHMMLMGSAVWMLCGVLVMRKMINFDY